MKSRAVLLAASVILACGPAPAQRGDSPAVSPAQGTATESQKASTGGAVDFLLTSAAMDFHTHGPAGPLRFRDVRAGHVVSAAGEERNLLCGQVLGTQGGSQAEWLPFATIKTSGYEQYVGAQSATWCGDSAVVWGDEGDLSPSLQRRLDSLR